MHLILEYARGEALLDEVAPRANRFILHSDRVNGALGTLEAFHAAAADFAPHILVAAGVHLLQEQESAAFRSQRLADVRRHLSTTPSATAVHLEYASIGDADFVREVTEELLPAIDSLGCNEQELGDMYRALGGAAIAHDTFVAAPFAAVRDAVALLFDRARELRDATTADDVALRRLTRVHFHYLRYHAIFFDPAVWHDSELAVGAGAWAAAATACEFRDVSPEATARDFDEREVELDDSTRALMRDGNGRVQAVRRGELTTPNGEQLHYVVAPVLVCRKPRRTVGLGDTVSATALAATTHSLDK